MELIRLAKLRYDNDDEDYYTDKQGYLYEKITHNSPNNVNDPTYYKIGVVLSLDWFGVKASDFHNDKRSVEIDFHKQVEVGYDTKTGKDITSYEDYQKLSKKEKDNFAQYTITDIAVADIMNEIYKDELEKDDDLKNSVKSIDLHIDWLDGMWDDIKYGEFFFEPTNQNNKN